MPSIFVVISVVALYNLNLCEFSENTFPKIYLCSSPYLYEYGYLRLRLIDIQKKIFQN
jgi:hypothetical protein